MLSMFFLCNDGDVVLECNIVDDSLNCNVVDIGVDCNVVDVVYVMMGMLCWNVILLMIV